MGFALAEAAKNMGGNVTLVSGPVNLSNPNQIQFHNIESAKEMYDKLIQLIDYNDFDYIFMSAAISDYYTKKNHKKIKSNNEEIDLKLYKNPDILKEISSKSNATIIGLH